MKQIPTAKEIYLSKVFPTSFENRRDEVELWFETSPDAQQSVEIMIEFAKMHVDAQTESIINNIFNDFDMRPSIDNDSIRNAYTLNNIK